MVTRRAAVGPVMVSGRMRSCLARAMISLPCSMMAAMRSRRTPMMSRPLPTVVPSRYRDPASMSWRSILGAACRANPASEPWCGSSPGRWSDLGRPRSTVSTGSPATSSTRRPGPVSWASWCRRCTAGWGSITAASPPASRSWPRPAPAPRSSSTCTGRWTEPILRFGSEEQRRAWLPRLARGEVLGAFALTEPGSGSDAAGLRTTARRRGSEWVLTGTKVFVTNVGEAGLYIVFARTGEVPGARGVSAFLVPADRPGLRVGQIFAKMGLHGSPTGELVLEEVRVPAANLLHAPGRGFEVAMRCLDSGRIGISAQGLGIARAALGEALDRARAQGDGGRETAVALADLAARLEAGRGLVECAARRCSADLPFTREASMAKLFCTDLAMEAASTALEVMGEAGEEQGFGRHFRDAKALQIYEGTNQVQRVVIARQLLRPAAAIPASGAPGGAAGRSG